MERPRKYGAKLGMVVVAYAGVVILKTLRRAVEVVWVYRQNQWVALFSTDTSLSVRQIIEYYDGLWKIEALFKELKRDIGSAETQTRNPQAVKNHLHFCMMAASVAWIYSAWMAKTPTRRHTVEGRRHFAFSDVRRSIIQAALEDNFNSFFPVPRKSTINSLVTVLLRMAA